MWCLNVLSAPRLAFCNAAVTRACRTSGSGSLTIIPHIHLTAACGDRKGEVGKASLLKTDQLNAVYLIVGDAD